MIYLLDSNTYIEAKNFYYDMGVCPAYWIWLDEKYNSGVAGSIDFVGRELKDGNDELAEWAKLRGGHFLSCDDIDTQHEYSRIVGHVMAGNFNAANRDSFVAKADPWIIAKAKVIGATVVTHESIVAPETKKVKVPNICQVFGVRCIDTFSFLRETGVKFVLSTTK